MQKTGVSRKKMFDQVEKEALKPLPAEKYVIRHFKRLKVQINYHIFLYEDKHHYSVPYRFRGKQVIVVYTDSTVAIYYKNNRIAIHKRDRTPNGYTTIKDHMPSNHRKYSDWNPQRFINWAKNTGENVELVIRTVLQSRQHPEQSFKACLGILSLAKKYDKERLDKACEKAIYFQYYSYRGIKNILENNLENYQEDIFQPLPDHTNIRGNQYYY